MQKSLLFFLAACCAFGQNPVIRAVQNAASGNGSAIAPQMLVSIYGSNLSTETMPAGGFPLPTQLAGTTVKFNGMAAPLAYVSPTQINAQVPSGIQGQTSANVMVSATGGASDAFAVTVNPGRELGIFTQDGSGCGQGAVLNVHADGTATPNTPQNSFDPQKDLGFSIYLTGMGVFSDRTDGTPWTFNAADSINNQIGAGIGGLPGVNHLGVGLATAYAGPAPGLVGVDQINALYYPGPYYYFNLPPYSVPMPEGCRMSLLVTGSGNTDRASQMVNVSIHSGGGACQDAPPESLGLVTWQEELTSDLSGTSTTNSVTAQFLQAPAIGFNHAPITSVPSVDNWGYLPLPASFCPASYPVTLNAGPITATAPSLGPISIQAQEQNGLLGYQAPLSSTAVQGGQYSIAGPTGGSVVGPFSAAASIPAPITITTNLKPGTTITLPFTVNWTGGDADSLVTVQLIAHVPGQLALPELEATGPAIAGTRILAVPPAAAAFKFPQQGEDVEIIVTQQPAQAPSQPFSAPGLTLGGEQGWNYVFDFKGLAIQ